MRVALVSDIHGNLGALEAVLEHVSRQHVDAIWNLGDILSGPLQPAETADLLIPLALPTLGGNHERQLLACAEQPGGASDQFAYARTRPEHHAWLRALPMTLRPRPDVLLCHGTPAADNLPLVETLVPPHGLRLATAEETRERLDEPGARLIACGHSHIPRVVRAGDDCVVVNPGSVGLQAYDFAEGGRTYYIDAGSPEASYAVVEERAGHWQVDFFRVPYDWDAASRLAAANGRPEWAHALRTGFALRL